MLWWHSVGYYSMIRIQRCLILVFGNKAPVVHPAFIQTSLTFIMKRGMCTYSILSGKSQVNLISTSAQPSRSSGDTSVSLQFTGNSSRFDFL